MLQIYNGDFPHPFPLTKKTFQETLPMHDWSEKWLPSSAHCSPPPFLTLRVCNSSVEPLELSSELDFSQLKSQLQLS